MKIRSMTAQSKYNGAGPLNQNYTGRDHSIRITRGGSTQSEFHGAGALSQNTSLKAPIWTGVATRGWNEIPMEIL